MTNLEKIFNTKLTENGDNSFVNPSNDTLANILFLTEYYTKHLDKIPMLEDTDRNRLFAMMIRDPRFGFGKRDLGRVLMKDTNVPLDDIVIAGRFDDIWNMYDIKTNPNVVEYLYTGCVNNNMLCKKWMPRYTRKDKKTKTRSEYQKYTLQKACDLAKAFNMTKQEYGKFIKVETTESNLTNHTTEKINFESVPSLAMLKYFLRFKNGEDTKDRFNDYTNAVKSGSKNINVTVTNCYDIYKNRTKIDTDLFFDKIEKISGNWIPIVDTSGSMMDSNDSFGKALAIGHYLSKCSTYATNKVISFSSRPQLITLGNPVVHRNLNPFRCNIDSKYMKEINSMYTGDCSNTDFGAVMELLKNLNDVPEYLVVLSDMEFDMGSSQSKDSLMEIWKQNGYTTKIIWWNLNSRNITSPEIDDMGNIFISGYNPMILKYMETGFDNSKFLEKLLNEYEKNIR